MSNSKRPPLAVVGVSALFPGSLDASGFWSDILAGSDLLTDVPSTHWLPEDYYDEDPKARDKTYAKRGGFIPHVDFDPMGWGVPPNIIKATDTSQLLGLIVAEQVLRDAARSQFESMDRSRISVILGVTSAQELLASMISRLQRPVWVKSLREHGVSEDEVNEICDRIAGHYTEWEESSFPGLLGNVVAGRIANRLNLGGTNCVTDAACASTFAAISMAAQELYLGDSDMVITGGVDTLNDIFMFMCFSKTPALSASGDCRPFSDKADGTMLGEGLGMVAIKRLDDAERDGDRIYAVLEGIGSSSDGRSKSVYAPVSAGQSQALRRAWKHAGVDPRTVELIEAHGTGTKAGDVAEFNGLRLAFGSPEAPVEGGVEALPELEGAQWCALGSVKSQIGHTKAAAGAAGLFKAVMALHHKVLPPSIKIDQPNPKLDVEGSPFYLSTEARPWIRGSDHPRRAGVSAFGFGGSNFHIVLSEYTGEGKRAERLRTLPAELIVISADDGAGVIEQARAMLVRCDEPGVLRALARTSQRNFSDKHNARLGMVAADEAELRKALEGALAQLDKNPDKAFKTPTGTTYGVGQREGEVALLFPGQGSQYVGMCAELAMYFDVAREAWDEAANVDLGEADRLPQIVYPIPRFDDEARQADELRLRQTQWAQPAIGCASAAMFELVRALGIGPVVEGVAGHSFGEITALYTAGVLSEADMLRVARKRGELMAAAGEASRPGTMTAVVATEDGIRQALSNVDGIGDVVLANINAPRQVVISGPVEDIERAEHVLEMAEVTTRRLPVASAFHSPLVAPSVEPFTEFLGGLSFGKAKVPVYSCESGLPYEGDPSAIVDRLGRQIAKPVRFTDIIENMYEAGIRTFIEVGPKAVLSGLVRKILKRRPHHAVPLDQPKVSGVVALLRALSKLAAAGVPLNFDALWQGYAEPVDPRDEKQPKLAVAICGSNAQKPYPPAGGAAELPPPNPPKPKSAPLAAAKSEPVAAKPAPAAAKPAFAHAPAPESAPMTKLPPPPTPAPSNFSPSPVQAFAPAPQQPAFAPQFTAAPAAASVDVSWLNAWQEAQRQTAQTHAVVQQAMANSHAAFLQATQSSLSTLAALAGVPVAQAQVQAPTFAPVPAPAPVQPFAAAPAPVQSFAPAPVQQVAPAPAPVQVAPAPAPVQQVAPAPAAPVQQVAPAPAPVQQVAPAPAAPGVDLEALMLSVVSEKTGYPESMLELGMDMEAELGIDSIKRVEILAAVQEQAPGLPPVDAGHMGGLRTLGEIVDYMRDLMGDAAPASAPAAAAPAAPGVDLEALMLSVVAEKTGYPESMLELGMDMEAELGIDSIKRVEILAAVQEQAPGLPPVDAGHMGGLRTLGEIVGYMRSLMGDAAPAGAPAAAAPGVDLEALMLAVVAEKTGYPESMLELGMDMEAELGIDSIKRVEILAAVQEQAPGLPPVDAGHMGALRTLGEIVEYMRGLMGEAAPASAPAAAAPSVDLEALMLAVVADKTGYPESMLELGMDMEAELGIDSIKRVEILAAVQEQAPGLPPVDAGHMGALRTLGEIVEYMRGLMGEAAPASAPAATAPTTSVEVAMPELGRYALELIPAPAIGLAQPGLREASGLYVSGGGEALDSAVASSLRERGLVVHTGASLPAQARAALFLGGLREVSSSAEAVEINREAFRLARALARQAGEQRVVLVSAQDTGGSFGLEAFEGERAYLSGLPAMIKTAKQEWPTASLKAIDIARAGRSASELAEALADELLLGGGELEVALSATGERRTLRSFAAPLDANQTQAGPVAKGEVIVVSGGARGVTSACVIEWAKRTQARFALLGRSALGEEPTCCAGVEDDAGLKRALLAEAQAKGEKLTPATLNKQVKAVLAGREIRATLAAVAAAGGEARYLSADVQDTAAVSAALATVRSEWGPIVGLVHGAGVLADKLIAELSDEQFDWAFNTKISGIQALLAATAEDPLKVLCMFSSVSARCGNNGQCAYAMANEILNKVAQAEAKRRPGLLVKSLGWGPWKGGMVNPQLERRFAELGVPMIPLQVGADMLASELAGAEPSRVELVLGGEPRPEALLVKGSEARELEFEVVVSRRTHAYLADHTIAGTVVVPVVLVMDWFSRLARAFRPDLQLQAITELKVLRSIKLSDFEGTGDRLQLRCRQLSNGHGVVLALEVTGGEGALHYRAKAKLDPAGSAPAIEQGDTPAPALSAWGDASIYGDVLFHGEEFQVIETLDGVGDDGIAGTLKGVHKAGWRGEPWQVDVAALDGGLQLAVLWARERMGGATLPMGIGELRIGDKPLTEGPVRVVASCRRTSDSRATANVMFLDQSGARLSELRDAELIMRPDTPRARA